MSAAAPIGILAIGATFVIGARGIDLSVGSLMALCAVGAVSFFAGDVEGTTIWGMLFTCVLMGGACGACSGSLIQVLNLPPFVVTLAMMSIARGLALIVSDGRALYGLPPALVFLGQGTFMGIPIPAYIFIAVAIGSHAILRRTRFGIRVMMLGDNPTAVRLCGISMFKTTVLLYTASGIFAAIAAVVTMGRINAADPNMGTMYELAAITAAVIGGSSLRGGVGSVVGTVLGALTVGVIQNGLTLLDISAYYQQLLLGVVLIIATLYHRTSRYDAAYNT
jgi:ribose transport system permease protein